MSTRIGPSTVPDSDREFTLADASIEVIGPEAMRGELASQWEWLRQQNPSQSSPYFDLEFVRAVSRVRQDVEIGVVRDSHQAIICFLPYQRVGKRAEPIGGRLNDVHGLIGNPVRSEFITRILQAGGLNSYSFHASVMDANELSPFVFCQLDSHFLDLQQGWHEYVRWAHYHSSTLARQGQKTRALERDIGELRLEFDDANPENLERLIELKRNKYQRSKTFDILSVRWAADLLRELHKVNKPNFTGMLSSLFAGDQLVAAHFGLMTDRILHYWFPVFDPVFSKYSPGTELLWQVAKEASLRGIEKVDLGYGDDRYKFKFCNGRSTVRCGQVTRTRVEFELARRRFELRQRLKHIPMKPLAKSVLRFLYPGFGQSNFQ